MRRICSPWCRRCAAASKEIAGPKDGTQVCLLHLGAPQPTSRTSGMHFLTETWRDKFWSWAKSWEGRTSASYYTRAAVRFVHCCPTCMLPAARLYFWRSWHTILPPYLCIQVTLLHVGPCRGGYEGCCSAGALQHMAHACPPPADTKAWLRCCCGCWELRPRSCATRWP